MARVRDIVLCLRSKFGDTKRKVDRATQLVISVVPLSHLDGETVEAGLLLFLGLGVFRQDPSPDGRQRYSVFLIQKVRSLFHVYVQCRQANRQYSTGE